MARAYSAGMNELWKRLFLAFALLIITAVGSMVLILHHEFRKGFQGYVFALDVQRAERVADRIERFRAEQGNWNALREEPALMRFLAAEDGPEGSSSFPMSRQSGRGSGDIGRDAQRPPRRFGPPGSGWNRPPRGPPEPGRFGQGPAGQPDRPLGPPPRGVPEGVPTRPEIAGPEQRPLRGTGPEWMSRLSLFDELGQRLHGPSVRVRGGAVFPIEVAGTKVGELYLQPAPELRDEPSAEFLGNQAQRALIIAAIVLALALVVSGWLARRLLAPLPAIKAAVRALAQGRYDPPGGLPDQGAFAELSGDVRHLAGALAQHQQSRQQWTADIAHELRTPVAILMGEIEAIEDGVRPVDAKSVASLRAECHRLRRLVDDLYQLSLSDVGGLNYRFAPVDLAALVRERCALHEPAARQAGLALVVTAAPSTLPVTGDHERLEQLLSNLLGNCMRYTDAPGRIEVSLSRRGSTALLRIEDSPPGVPDEALPRLFERLFRVDRSRSRDTGGAGLGLAIAERIVDAHRGRIRARHAALGGLAIDIDLPIEATTP